MSLGSTSGIAAEDTSRKKVWVITGTSSGLGRSLVNEALAHGDNVIATARKLDSIHDYTTNPKTADRVHIMTLDVTAPFAELREKAAEAVAKWGLVDCLVNNAGLGMLGLVEEVGVEGFRKQFDTNFFGPMNVTNAFLPYMRERRMGTIVFIGSRSSWRTDVPMMGTYASSKAALSAAAEALAVEVAPLNIKILNVLPGGLRTQTWDNMRLLPTSPGALMPPIAKQDVPVILEKPSLSESNEDQHIADYAELRKRQLAWMYDAARRMPDGDADKCARAIVDVVSGPDPDSKESEGEKRGGWPALGMLVLGADAEMNIRDKCDVVLKNLGEWKEVVRGIAIDPS